MKYFSYFSQVQLKTLDIIHKINTGDSKRAKERGKLVRDFRGTEDRHDGELFPVFSFCLI